MRRFSGGGVEGRKQRGEHLFRVHEHYEVVAVGKEGELRVGRKSSQTVLKTGVPQRIMEQRTRKGNDDAA